MSTLQSTKFWNSPQWIAFYTQPRAEKKVYERLLQQGFIAYLPLIKRLRQWSDRKKWIESPLFPNYVFAKLTQREYTTAIRTPGIVCAVWFSGKPVFVPEEQIEAIQRFIENGFSLTVHPITEIVPGDFVKIVSGPFRGITGEVLRIKGKERFVIRINAIGTAVSVELQGWYLQKQQYSTQQTLTVKRS